MTRSFFSRLKHQAHHLLFALSLSALAAPLAWWSVFIGSAFQGQRTDRFEILLWETKLHVKVLESE